jgi:hypothetical protein
MAEASADSKEPLLTYAHRQAIKLAGQTADPILQPELFNSIYWVVMGGFGFRPYYPGCPS